MDYRTTLGVLFSDSLFISIFYIKHLMKLVEMNILKVYQVLIRTDNWYNILLGTFTHICSYYLWFNKQTTKNLFFIPMISKIYFYTQFMISNVRSLRRIIISSVKFVKLQNEDSKYFKIFKYICFIDFLFYETCKCGKSR